MFRLKKTKTFVGDIELRSRPVTCTAKHSGPFLMQTFAKLDFWTLESYIKCSGVFFFFFFFLSWIGLLPGQNVNENRILGSFGWKVPGEDGTSQKMAWFPIGIFLSEIPDPFFLQDFFNLSLLLVSVFCGHFSAARTYLCKGNSRTEFAGPEFCLPAVTLNYRDHGFLMLMEKQLALSRWDSKAGSLPIWRAWLTGLVRWTSTRSARAH